MYFLISTMWSRRWRDGIVEMWGGGNEMANDNMEKRVFL